MNDDQLNARMDTLFAGLRGTNSAATCSASSDDTNALLARADRVIEIIDRGYQASNKRAAEMLTASPEPLSEQVRKQHGAESKRVAADIIGSHMPSFQIDENQLMEQMRQQQALIAAKSAEMAEGDSSEDSYVRILGENFDLIQDDIPAEELDRRIAQLWSKEGDRIKKEALAAIERANNSGFFDTLLKSAFSSGIQPSDEQKETMLRAANNSIRESVENNNTASTLKMRIDYMRKVFAVHKACLAQKAQACSSSSSSMHHTIQ